MKTAIIATALLTSLATTVMLRMTDGAPTSVDHLRNSVSPGALDMRATGSVPAVVHANRQAAADKGARLGEGNGDGSLRITPPISPFAGETGPAAQGVQVAQATSGASATDVQPSAEGAVKLDETALRYFARQGDQKRLDAEIARLRTLYPEWTPPADPLAVPNVGDARLDAMWQLYAQGNYAALRKAIADRRAADPAWQVPTDLTERLAVAEARERLVNASDLKQFETVVRTAAETPSLLTCSEVDVLWRVGEAFASTERPQRARDAFKYILDNCEDTPERVATLQKAIPLLDRPALDELLALERTDANGVGEFEPARLSLARQLVADAGDDPKLVVPKTDLDRMVAATEPQDGAASDAQLLGWYYIRREDPTAAERWFTLSREREDTAEASQGLALAQVELGKPGEAEDVLYRWRDETVEIHNVYQAAVANYIATEPRIAIEPARLKRMADETAEAQDPAAAQQFGWYARDLNQHQTAGQWFLTALHWKPDDEPSAYGLVLTRNVLGDRAGVAEIQKVWAGRSERIANLGEGDDRTRLDRGLPVPADQPDMRDLTSAYSPAAGPQPTNRQGEPLVRQPTGEPVGRSANDRAANEQQPLVVPAGEPVVERYATAQPVETSRAAPLQEAYTASRSRAAANQPVAREAQARATSQPRGCAATDTYSQANGQAALARGWCLMELNRPLEAVNAFQRAMETGSADVQRDAAYGQSLAYLRRNLVDDAAVAASKAPQPTQRAHQLEVDILTQRATGFFEQKRFNEALLALDQRARITPEQTDLMVMRGYAYVSLGRLGDAERVFKAVAATGNREGRKGMAVVNDALGRP